MWKNETLIAERYNVKCVSVIYSMLKILFYEIKKKFYN